MAERIDVTLTGLRDLRGRIALQQLEAGDWTLFDAMVQNQIARAEGRQERMAAKAAAAATERGATTEGESGGPIIDADYSIQDRDSAGSATPSGTDGTDGGPEGSGGVDATGKREPEKTKGHGRNGARAYSRAKQFVHALVGVIGTVCEACGLGKMRSYREKIIIRIVGQPLFSAEAHHHEQARCWNCGHIERATASVAIHEGIGSDYVRYDWSACAILMVMHYFSGLPFKRLESLHQGWGVPMADANQWFLVSACHDLLLALYRALERHAIHKATNFRIDDTGSMVISIQRQIVAEIAALQSLGEPTKHVRTGINATGVYWETPDGPVVLFYTGRHHQGEITDQLLEHRPPSSPKLVKATDGASKSFDHQHADKVIESVCNAHAFLKLHAIKDKYPAEYAVAASVYKQVFDNDDTAKALGLTPVDRMLYHRQHSKPLMETLKKMCAERLQSKLVEPNSLLWEPLSYIINQWDRLIRFCEVPGVPLDTNLVEQVLIIPVRYLSGSFNYQTEDGAVVGDRAMSLIATARANGIEPVAYLTECLRCHEDLAKRPDHYLPWAYRERMKEGESPPGLAPEEPREPSRRQPSPQPG